MHAKLCPEGSKCGNFLVGTHAKLPTPRNGRASWPRPDQLELDPTAGRYLQTTNNQGRDAKRPRPTEVERGRLASRMVDYSSGPPSSPPE